MNNQKSPENKKAAALKYDINKDNAPLLIAKGEGWLAQKIIEKAKEDNIPLEKDQDIIDVLVNMNIGQEIPPELYRAIAEIFSFIYNLEKDL